MGKLELRKVKEAAQISLFSCPHPTHALTSFVNLIQGQVPVGGYLQVKRKWSQPMPLLYIQVKKLHSGHPAKI